jgi:hypothetical protein
MPRSAEVASRPMPTEGPRGDGQSRARERASSYLTSFVLAAEGGSQLDLGPIATPHVRLGSLGDIPGLFGHVSFGPESRHRAL